MTSVAGNVICTNEYAPYNGSHVKSVFADGTETGTTYDEYGRVTSNSMDGKEIEIMKVYGYKENSDEFVELSEASIECTMDELKKISKFFLEIYEQHKKAQGKTEYCHSHYRDWDEEWNENGSDLIVISTFDK